MSYSSQVPPVYITTSACACVSFQLPLLAVFNTCLGSHCWASRPREQLRRTKRRKARKRPRPWGKGY